MEFLTNNFTMLVGGGSSAIALWLLKKIPNESLYSWVEAGSCWLGTTVTLGMSKWRFSRKAWNSTVEPYFIDLIDNTVGAAVKGFIKGLRSDN